MAANNITFKIAAEYVGEGFKRAKKDIENVNKNVKKGAEAVAQLHGSLGQMDAEAAKALGAMTGLAQAILTFNVTAIATQVTILAINRYFGEMKKKAEEAKQKADELHASLQKAFADTLTTRISSINNEIKTVGDDFERVTKQANQFAAALEGVRNAEANGGVIQLQVEKLNALLEAHGEEQRQNIEAAYNLKIAIQKSADTETAWQAKIDAAHQAIVDNENRLANIDKQISTIGEERRQLEQTMLVAKKAGDKQWLEIQKQVTSLWEQEAALEQKKLDVEAQMDVQRQEEKRVRQEAINAQGQATIEIRNAELAEKKLTEAKNARIVKENAAKDAAELKAIADNRDAAVVNSAADIQQRANKAAKDLASAEEAYAKKIMDYNSNGLVADAVKAYLERKGKAGLLPVDVQKGIQLKTADEKVDDAIRKGTITTVKDASRAHREAMREARNTISNQQHQQIIEAQRYNRLKEISEAARSETDKAFMAQYEKIQSAAEERKTKIEEAKAELEKQREDAKKSREDLDNIKTKLEQLGLK